MIRIHVCPRKDAFDPSKWNTTLTDLKGSLLKLITGKRVTEAVPCLSEGMQVETLQSDSYHDLWANTSFGLWIGRSRFEKHRTQRSPNIAHVTDVQDPFAMESSQRGADCGAAALRPCSARELVSAGASHLADGAAPPGACGRPGGSQGPLQDVAQAAGGRVPTLGHQTAGQADSGPHDAPDSRPEEVASPHGALLWPLQGMALQRGSQGVSGVGCGRDGQERECLPGPGALCNLGQGDLDHQGDKVLPEQDLGPGSGSPGGDPATCDGNGVGWKHMEPGVQQSIAEGTSGFRHGSGDAITEPTGGACHVGTPPGGIEASGEGEEHALSGHPLVIKDVEKYVFMVVDDDSSEPSADLEAFEVLQYDNVSENDSVPDTNAADVIFDAIKPSAATEFDAVSKPSEVPKYEEGVFHGDRKSPRQKARDGLQKRKWDRMSLGKKAGRITTQQLYRLSEVLMTMTLALGSWTKETIGDPLVDLHAVFASKHDHGPSWNSESFGHHPVDCLEIFSGHSKISGAFADRRRGVLQPRDLIFGHDLHRQSDRDEVFKDLYRYTPRMVWLAPPCTAWCGFSRLNFSPQERRRRRSREQDFIKLVEEVIVFQRAHQGLVVVENPRTSDIWNHSALRRWYHDPDMHLSQVDLCSYGLESEQGIPMRKGLTLLTNSATFVQELDQRCTGDHEHQRVEGRETARSAVYPDKFAKAVVRAFDAWRNVANVGVWSERGPIAPHGQPVEFPTTSTASSSQTDKAEEGAVAPLPIGGGAISFKGKVNPTVASLLKRVHQNLGHPPTRELVRHLKIGGAHERVVRAAEQLVCKTCECSSRPRSHKVASPVVALDFNEVIAIDIIWFDTAESSNHPGLNVIDLASTYQVVIPLANTKAEEVGKALCSGWFRWAGVPKQLLVDLDSAFKGDFLTLMDERSVSVRSAAAQAHWQNGVAERHGETWKLIWAKLVEDFLVVDSEIDEAVAAVCNSKNSLRNRSGYSPRQWVFGVNQRLPGDLFDGDHEMSTLDAASAESKFGRLQTIRNGAKAAFFQVHTKDAYQRAVNHKARVQPAELQVGDLAFIYRENKQGKTKKPSASWTGPATVIGREGQNFWLARGGRCYLVAPEHLRPACPEEVSEALRLRMAMKEVKKLIDQDFSEFSEDEPMEIDESYVPVPDDEDITMEAAPEQAGGRSNPLTQPAVKWPFAKRPRGLSFWMMCPSL